MGMGRERAGDEWDKGVDGRAQKFSILIFSIKMSIWYYFC